MPAWPPTEEKPRITRETAATTTAAGAVTTTVILRRSPLFQTYWGFRASVPVGATPSLRNRSRACMASLDLG